MDKAQFITDLAALAHNFSSNNFRAGFETAVLEVAARLDEPNSDTLQTLVETILNQNDGEQPDETR